MFLAFQVKQLESLQSLVNQFNVTIYQALSDYRSDTNNSSTNITSILSQMFCGRKSTFIGEEENSFEKTMKEQTDYFEEDKKEDEETVYIYQNDTSEFVFDYQWHMS